MSGKTSEDYAKDYTDPDLRERLKEEIKRGDKGGKPGEWSARKSQLLRHEYEARGGGYKHEGERTDAQKSLEHWTDEDWQTSDGKVAIRDGKTTRYLPKKVWDELTPTEKAKTDRLKVEGSKGDHQFVGNPEKVREILREVREDDKD
ncbi:hypothetical protein EON81_26185 [bacterium]|nr:MAG: hypothetical protein EON81_26185 [bacterium]